MNDGMGVLDNLKGLMRSAEIKQKESMIGRDAVTIGAVESTFLNNYETFKVGLETWIEHILIEKGNKSMVLRPKAGTDAAKFLRYTLEDPSITEFYSVTQRTGGEFVYQVKGSIEDLLNEPTIQDIDEEDDNVLYV